MYMDHWGFGNWGILAGLVMMLFWVLVIVGIVFLVRWLVDNAQRTSGTPPGPAGRASALDLLNERYARGEITRDQYLQMRQDLGA